MKLRLIIITLLTITVISIRRRREPRSAIPETMASADTYQISEKEKKNAIDQTTHARQLLYKPNTFMKETIGKIADVYLKFLTNEHVNISEENLKKIFDIAASHTPPGEDFNIVSYVTNVKNGIYGSNLVYMISTLAEISDSIINFDPVKQKEAEDAVKAITKQEKDYDASDKAKVEKSKKYLMFAALVKSLSKFLFGDKITPDQAEILMMELGRVITKTRSADVVFPRRVEMRKNFDIEARSGVLSVNNDDSIDTTLKAPNDATKIKKAIWPVQAITKTFLDKATLLDEPIAGLFSGTFPNLLLVLDLLSFKLDVDTSENLESHPLLSLNGKDLSVRFQESAAFFKDTYAYKYVAVSGVGTARKVNSLDLNTEPKFAFTKTAELDSQFRQSKVALATAYLLGIGFHSAVEVWNGMNEYYGKAPKLDELKQYDLVKSTTDVIDLLKGFSDQMGKKKKRRNLKLRK